MGNQKNRNPFIDHPEYVESIWSNLATTVTTNESKFRVYPNPAKDFVNIELSNIETAEVRIYSVGGEVVLNTQITGVHRLSTGSIGSGLYFFQIVVSD